MNPSRRHFLTRGSGLAAASFISTSQRWAGANDRIRVAVMGMGGRGGHLMMLSAKIRGVEVAAICDPDENRMRTWAASLEALTNRTPRLEPDIRRIIEDPEIDAIIITCCNHWHALAAVWACQAGKHAYVEKPVAHNLFEGRKLVEAARKYNCVVQGGTQHRSNPRIQKAVRLLREGVIGQLYMARWIIAAHRPPIGFQPAEQPPHWLHWDLWLGPAPQQPYHRNLVHYNWHWFWDFGNGEMGNNGAHFMDVARWGLGKRLPSKVHSVGGRYGYKDQAQTPNTQTATFQYDDGTLLACDIRGVYTGEESGWWFYGSDGSMWMSANGEFKVYWLHNKSPDPTRSFSKEMDAGVDPSRTGDYGHLANFFEAIRERKPQSLRAEIEEIYISCALCLLANISYRLKRQLHFDPITEKFVGDAEADRLLTRNYRPPFVVPEKV